MKNPDKVSTVSRRALILEKLDQYGQVDVPGLSQELKVSEVTIRNDLIRLEQKNMLIRARGGAIKVDRVGIDFNLSDKNKQHLGRRQPHWWKMVIPLYWIQEPLPWRLHAT